MKNNKGFTLIELLAVIAVLAVIMIIAVPSILGTLESAREKTFKQMADKISIAISGKLGLISYEMKESDPNLNDIYFYIWDLNELVTDNNGLQGVVETYEYFQNASADKKIQITKIYLMNDDNILIQVISNGGEKTKEFYGEYSEVLDEYNGTEDMPAEEKEELHDYFLNKEDLVNKESLYKYYKRVNELMGEDIKTNKLYDGPTGKRLSTIYG